MVTGKKNNIANYAIIVLAAGASSRLGKPKQLLPYNGKSLLHHILDITKQVNASPVIVVLGANSNLISKEIAVDKNIHTVINSNWEEGIASSIRAGLHYLQEISPSSDMVIFTVCDQPFITASLLNNMAHTQKKTGLPIVASTYENTIGTPVLFRKRFFTELLALEGDNGAKKIVLKYPDACATVLFPKGNIDIDTVRDYEALNKTATW